MGPVGIVKVSEMPLETVNGGEMNIQYMGNCSGGHSCILVTSVAWCFVTNRTFVSVAFYCGQPKAHMCNNNCV